MPRDRDKPRPPSPLADKRMAWETAFKVELVKLRPHLEGAPRLLTTAATMVLAHAGMDSDPAVEARRYHAKKA